MKLFEPLQVGKRTFKNRIMFPPMNFCYEDKNGYPSSETIRYLTEIARGGAAYVVLGEIYPVDTAKKSPKITSDRHIRAFRKLSDPVHGYGALIGGQIYYPDQDINTITPERLMQIRDDFLQGVDRLVQAGFDAIQLSGENFLGSMSSGYLNKRKDEYGGTLKKRLRFLLELIGEIKRLYPETILEYKLTVKDEPSWKGLTLNEARTAAGLLESAGLDIIHAAYTHSLHGETVPAMGIKPYGCFTGIAGAIKKEVAIPVSAVGRIIEPQTAEAILETGQADVIALGRALIADPRWAVKVSKNEPIRYCVGCNVCLDRIAAEEKLRCSLHTGTGADQNVKQKEKPKKIIVAGGGVAGLEAARIAALQGHRVTLYEKSCRLGGQVLLASAPPRKTELLRFIDFLGNEMIRLKVDVKLGRGADEDTIIKQKPDRVIIAVGAKNKFVPVEGSDLPHVFDSWEILAGTRLPFGDIGIIGGSFVGIEVAEYLCIRGNRVFIVEMEDAIGIGESSSIWPAMVENYKKYGVRFYPSHTLKKILTNGVICSTRAGEVTIPCSSVVMATNGRPVPFSLDKIKKAGIKADKIGDCKVISNIEAAVNAAAHSFIK